MIYSVLLVSLLCYALSCPTLRPHGPGSSVRGSLQARAVERVGSPLPPPVGLPSSGMEPRSPACGQILHRLSHQASPRTLQWVAYPFSRGPSQPWSRTRSTALQVHSLLVELLHIKTNQPHTHIYPSRLDFIPVRSTQCIK